jgi:hypothetical protein
MAELAEERMSRIEFLSFAVTHSFVASCPTSSNETARHELPCLVVVMSTSCTGNQQANSFVGSRHKCHDYFPSSQVEQMLGAVNRHVGKESYPWEKRDACR